MGRYQLILLHDPQAGRDVGRHDALDRVHTHLGDGGGDPVVIPETLMFSAAVKLSAGQDCITADTLLYENAYESGRMGGRNAPFLHQHVSVATICCYQGGDELGLCEGKGVQARLEHLDVNGGLVDPSLTVGDGQGDRGLSQQ